MSNANRRRVDSSVATRTTGGSVVSASSGRERALESELAEDAGHYHINRASALEVDFSRAIVGLYASMADVGDPNGSLNSTAPWPYYPTVWPTYDQQSSRAALLFDGQRSPASADQLRAAKCDFWDNRFLEAAGAAAGTG